MNDAARPRLLVVIGSTRPGRIGLPIARWFAERARGDGRFDVEVADLAEIGLPLMDEPHHPRLRQYVHEHTLRWSATVAAADAVVFVTPEYNYGLTAPVKNAIDYLHHEWRYKAAGFVSYGGVAGRHPGGADAQAGTDHGPDDAGGRVGGDPVRAPVPGGR